MNGADDPAAPVMERSLEGYYLPAVENELEHLPGVNFTYRYEYSDTYPAGVIYKPVSYTHLDVYKRQE